MEKRELKSNYIIAFINFFLFLLLFCLIYAVSRSFIKTLKASENIRLWVLFMGLSFPFIFYTFVADLNSVYEKVQNFFFRHTFLTLVVPSVLMVLLLGYFFLPKIFGMTFNKQIFLFFGGAAFSLHIIFVAGQLKSTTFSGFINYVFVLSVIYLFCLVILGVYIILGFEFPLKEALMGGVKEGFSLIRSVILQLLPH